jgi:hypothetical protein
MIVKVVPKTGVKAGSHFNHLFIEGNRIEISFHKDQPSNTESDWSYSENKVFPEEGPCYCVRSWKAWPTGTYEVGYVWKGRIFLVNDAGKTVDKYVI